MQEMKHCVFLATDVAARGVTLPNTHIVNDTNLERTIEGTVPVVKDALATLDMRLHKSVQRGNARPALQFSSTFQLCFGHWDLSLIHI